MSFLDDIGIDKEIYEKTEAQDIRDGYSILPSGAYTAKVQELATFTTANGARQFKVQLYIPSEDRTMDFYQTITNGNGDKNEIGTRSFRHLIDAMNTPESDFTVVNETIKVRGKDIEAKAVKGVKDKTVIAMIMEVHQKGAYYEESNEVTAWARVDGTNAKGEDIVTKFNNKIAEKPILKKPDKITSTKSTNTQNSELKKDVDSMI